MSQNHQTSTYHRRISVVLYLATIFLISVVVIYHLKLDGEVRAQDAREYFDALPIQANAVYVYDAETDRVIYGRNEHLPLPLASITKIMTALCALDNLDREGVITIATSTLETYGDPQLKIGDTWRVDDLVSYMLVKSSNDAAMTLSQALGGSSFMVTCMNKRAEGLGLFETKFYNETGLDIDTEPGAYGSAEDAAMLLWHAVKLYPDIFGRTRYQSYNIETLGGSIQIATNTNRVQDQIIGMEASKTGLTDLAGGNLVFEMNVGLSHKIVVAILGSTGDGRFEDALLLSRTALDYLGNLRDIQ